MGADFSIPLLQPTPAAPPPTRRHRRHLRTLSSSSNNISSSDASTLANTLANRSPTPVARHVALARLADRLSSLRRSRRQRVIDQLHIPSAILREVRRYTPSHSFASVPEADAVNDDEDVWTEDDTDDDDPVEEQANEIDSEPGSPGRSVSAFPPASDGDPNSSSGRRKFVSFAKYAEMRLFKE